MDDSDESCDSAVAVPEISHQDMANPQAPLPSTAMLPQNATKRASESHPAARLLPSLEDTSAAVDEKRQLLLMEKILR